MTLLRRIPLIIVALAVAGVAALGVFVAFGGESGFGDIMYLYSQFTHAMIAAPRTILKFVTAAGFALVLVLGVAVIAEILRLRSFVLYSAAAVIVALAGNFAWTHLTAQLSATSMSMIPELFQPGTSLMLSSTAAGLAAGIVYWLVAGRNAGGQAKVRT
jgi:hypothetical protein